MARTDRPAPNAWESAHPGPPALAMPLLLFVQGIVAWVDRLPDPDGAGSPTAPGPLGVTAAFLTIASAGAACWLVVRLAETLPRATLTTTAVTVAAFGAGVTGVVTLGTLTGLLDAGSPAALTSGGPFLVGAGLSVLLVHVTAVGRMPLGSLGLAALGAVVLAAPLDLVPLGAVLLLLALGPVVRGAEPMLEPALEPLYERVHHPVPEALLEPVPERVPQADLEPARATPAATRTRPEAGPAAYGDGGLRSGARHPAPLG